VVHVLPHHLLVVVGVEPQPGRSARKAHLEAGEPQTLEAVREAMRAGEASQEREIPVYESDGETIIGVFTVGDGSTSFESSSVEERSGR